MEEDPDQNINKSYLSTKDGRDRHKHEKRMTYTGSSTLNEPNNPGQGDNCVEVKDGFWRDDLCQIEKNFIFIDVGRIFTIF